MTRVAEQRRALPPGACDTKNYRFKDSNGSELGLIDLFGEHDAWSPTSGSMGRSRERPCPMRTNWLGA
jgi:predicted dithiol-disulfide oxidoreductase (DUF899 family)